jgi:putative transposase
VETQFFDPDADYSVIERRLPHWTQARTVCFITWRTADSMPAAVVARWIAERDMILRAHGISAGGSLRDPRTGKGLWQSLLDSLPKPMRDRVKWLLTEKWDNYLDECHGDCVLRRPDLSKIVADSLLHFDKSRYELFDFVVMPNHVHLLAAFANEQGMLKQCESWKRYTAVQINRQLNRRGKFWQEDGFDHLVRSEEHFEHYRSYIEQNPLKCELRPEEYRLYSSKLSGQSKRELS